MFAMSKLLGFARNLLTYLIFVYLDRQLDMQSSRNLKVQLSDRETFIFINLSALSLLTFTWHYPVSDRVL